MVVILSTYNSFWQLIKIIQYIKGNANVNVNNKKSGKEKKIRFN